MILRSGRRTGLVAVGLVGGMALGVAGAQDAALGNISGIVRDGSGAVVPGAMVVITNKGTGATRTLTTDSEGHYAATFLQPGHYRIVLGGNSFGTVNDADVAVTVGSTATVDATLPASTVTTDVNVTTDEPLIDNDKVETSQTIPQTLVTNLPVNGRRWDNFVLLTPNVVPDGNSGLISYRGVSGLYNTNLVDGANNQQAFFSEARGRSIGAPYVYPLDSIQEFQSSVTGYSAELGGAAGGIVNAITKSGTNQFHGDAFEYYRTPGFNALDPLSKYNGRLTNNPYLLSQPVKVQNQFGISVGGPIIKDKLFFHATYDGYRRVNPITYLSSYNTATTSIANLVHLCDGGTTNVNDNGVIYPTTITGISAGQCTQTVNFFQNTLLGQFARNTTQDIYFPRLDYQLTGKTHLSASFLFENFKQPNGYNANTTVNNGSVTQNGTQNFHERFLVVNAETALSANSTNVVHFQYSRDLETAGTNTGGPAISLTNVIAYGEVNALPRGAFPDEHRYQFTDIYSKVIGHHSFKGGVDVNLIHEQIANLFGGDGQFNYATGTAENEFANYIQDVFQVNGGKHYTSFSQTTDPITGVGADDFWNKNLDAFLEDEWKVTPKLLLSLGGRYDVQLVPQPDRPNTSSYPAFIATSVINIYYGSGQPRVGFAYTPQEGTVIRGGYGIFVGLTSNSTYYTERRENGVYQQQFSYNALAAPATTYAPIAAAPAGTVNRTFSPTGGGSYQTFAVQGGVPAFTPPGPAPINQVTGAATPAVNPGLPASTLNVRGLNYEFQNPFTHSVDLAVEQALPLKSTLTVAYAGTRGMRLPIFVDSNVDPASQVNAPFNYTNAKGVTTQFIEPVFTRRLSNNTGSVLTGYSDVNSWYNALAFSVRKPFNNGVEILANYTWAHTEDGGQSSGTNGTFNGTDAPLIPIAEGHRQGRGAEYGRSDLDVRGRFVGSIVAVSKFPIANRYLAYASNGWQMGATVTAQTGAPVTAFFSNTIVLTPASAATATKPAVASLLASTINGDGGITGAVVTSGTGTRVPDQVASRNFYKGPGIHNTDVRISREFPFLREGMRFEIAAEAFNIVNHRNVLGVTTTGFTYQAPGTAAAAGNPACPAATVVGGCIVPYNVTTGNGSFGAPSSTSGTLYTPRQLQLLGKLYF